MKTNPIKNIIIVAMLVAGVACLLVNKAGRLDAQEKPKTDAEITALLDQCVVQQRRAPGIVIAMIDSNGTRVFAQGVGQTGGAHVDGDTLFEIGSVTKTFTALLLQEMADRGEVSLDDPIGKYLPPAVKTPSRNGRQITLVDLATQTSGLPRLPGNFSPKDNRNPYADYTVGDLYDFLSHYQLRRDIGQKYEYSNLGVGLLGHLLSRRAGTNYEALAVRRICDPLGLTSTRITLAPELRSRLATGHDKSGVAVANWDIPALAGCGALRSTAHDLAIFVAANMGLTPSPISHAMMETHLPRHATGPRGQIGLVWQIDTAHGTLWHNGGTGGYHSYIGFKSDGSRGVVVLANSANAIDDLGQFLLGDRPGLEDLAPP